MLTPSGQPNMYQDSNTGRMVNLRDYQRFETSERVEGLSWRWMQDERDHFILTGWRFTVAKWPQSPAYVQQQVELKIMGRVEAGLPLLSILTWAADSHGESHRDHDAEGLKDLSLLQAAHVQVQLHEYPVEGAGLRVHLRGWRRPAFTS